MSGLGGSRAGPSLLPSATRSMSGLGGNVSGWTWRGRGPAFERAHCSPGRGGRASALAGRVGAARLNRPVVRGGAAGRGAVQLKNPCSAMCKARVGSPQEGDAGKKTDGVPLREILEALHQLTGEQAALTKLYGTPGARINPKFTREVERLLPALAQKLGMQPTSLAVRKLRGKSFHGTPLGIKIFESLLKEGLKDCRKNITIHEFGTFVFVDFHEIVLIPTTILYKGKSLKPLENIRAYL